MSETIPITLQDVEGAAERLTDCSIVQATPIEQSRSISEEAGGEVYLKMEHLQRTGSFKVRGAYNKLTKLADTDSTVYVVAASAGNHAQGVALAASRTGFPATIVMPTTAPQAKIDATSGYGADVVIEGRDFQAAVDHARSLAAADDAVLVHAYDDPDIVEGQGTLGLEVLDQVPDVDTVVVPVGGGGLVGGVATAIKGHAPEVRVVGVQAESAATVPTSIQKGEPHSLEEYHTIADGIATGGISELTYGLIRDHVDEVVTVTDEEIAAACLVLFERAKQLVEGAGAAPVAALLGDDLDVRGETVVPVLSGGNIDMELLRTVLTHELTRRKQLLRLRVRIVDDPGTMAELSGIIGDHGANIRTVHHNRADHRLQVGEAYLDFVVSASGENHARRICESIRAHGYEVERVN